MVFFVPIFIEIVFQRKQEQRIPKVHLVVLTTYDRGVVIIFYFILPNPNPNPIFGMMMTRVTSNAENKE